MNFRFGRHLSDGIAARLEFDYVCNRGHAFGEHYVHGVVNEILAAIIDPNQYRLRAGYAHPAIVGTQGGPGRPREIDFDIEDRENNNSVLCVEVKWADSNHAAPRNCLKDVLRLAAIKAATPSTECLFILAGSRSGVQNRLSQWPIARRSGGRRLLELPQQNRVPRKHPYSIIKHEDAVSQVANEVPSVPDVIYTTLVAPAHIDPKRFQALVWRVSV